MRASIAAVLFLLYLGILIWVLYETSYTRFQIWRTGTTVEAELVTFAFDQQEIQGTIGLRYELNGTTCDGQIDGYFSDFQQVEPVPILVAANNPEQTYWKSPVRFWFWEIIILAIWAFFFIRLTNWIVLIPTRQRRISDSAILIGMASIIFTFLWPQYQSAKDFEAASKPVMATIESVIKDMCLSVDRQNESHESPCYKPSYSYTVGQDTFHYQSIKVYNRQPIIGERQELWYWQQDPSVALNLSTMPTSYEYIFMMVMPVFLLFIALWNLLLRK